ncbi:DUF29 domain-containing protein [Hansschlegelia sp. KR7-227]|uniref:DUF29 domain-containing protein n=1 Tax=Hansschlegelia sp. KR7-227 TaxID=3400914 RepID=UPI003BFCCE78
MSAGYDEDFALWTERQSSLLREARFTELDLPHLIEEVESMGRERRRALQSSYRVLILHLLKWRHQPTHRSRSWAVTIVRERGDIEDLEDENPSLAAEASVLVTKAYRRARREAAAETELPLKSFPAECPFTLAQLRDDEYLPD